jgi:hypothetical protein
VTERSIRQDLVDEVERQAEWRGGRIFDHPEDKRSAQSASSLRTLAENLRRLPEAHPLFREVARRWAAGADDPGFREHEREVLREYGFHAERDGHPVDFLELYCDLPVSRRTGDDEA